MNVCPLPSGVALLRAVSLLIVLPFALAANAADPLPRTDPAKAGFSAAGLQRIDRFYADEIARDRIPGAVVAIAREGKLVYYKTHGYQDKAAGVAMKSDAIFKIGRAHV